MPSNSGLLGIWVVAIVIVLVGAAPATVTGLSVNVPSATNGQSIGSIAELERSENETADDEAELPEDLEEREIADEELTPGALPEAGIPNDALANATALSPGDSFEGAIEGSDDHNWYAITVPPMYVGQSFDFGVRTLVGDGELGVSYYNPDGTIGESASINASGTDARYAFTPRQAGMYYVLVESHGGTGSYGVSVSIGANVSPTFDLEGDAIPLEFGDEFEEGGDGTSLELGASVDGTIETVDDENVYSVDVTAGDTLVLYLNLAGVDGPLSFSLIDPDGNPIYFNGETRSTMEPGWEYEFTLENVRQGTYHVVVSSQGGTGDYTIEANAASAVESPPIDDPEDRTDDGNDDPNTATELSLDTPVRGEITDADDVDWYSFEAERHDLVVATIAEVEGTGTVSYDLYNPQQLRMTGLPVSTGSEGQIQSVIYESGTYYVAVSSVDGTGTYSLAVRIPGSEPYDADDVEDRFENQDAEAESMEATGNEVGSAEVTVR